MEKQYHLPIIQKDRTYQNPLPYGENKTLPTNPDPYVMKYGGKYYCYATHVNGVNISVSEDLTNWTYLGNGIEEEGKKEYWAPCVYYDNGTFYLYCSNVNLEEDDCHKEYLQLYTSENPEGPFKHKKTFFEKFSIDAHVVKDIDGEVYLFYSVNDYMGTDAEHSGTVIMVDRLINYEELAGEEKVVVLPSIEEEIFEKNRFGDGRDWYTIEGAFFFRHRRKAYMMYAANAYVRENYFLGYSSADSKQKIGEMNWEKYPNEYTYSPLVRRNEKVEGTGHNSVVKAPNLIDDWIIYHGRNQEEPLMENVEQRTMRMDPILYCGDRMLTNAPSYLEQEAPLMPLFSSKGIDDDNITSIEMPEGKLHILEKKITNYVMEVDVKAFPTHMGAVYGFLLSYEDEENYVEAIVNSGKRNITIRIIKNNIGYEAGCVKLPVNYRHDVLHHYRVERNINCFDLYGDEKLIFSLEMKLPFGKVGMVEKFTETEWISFAITEHAECYGERLKGISYLLKADEKVKFIESQDLLRIGGASKKEVTFTEIEVCNLAVKSAEILLDSKDAYGIIENETIAVEITLNNCKIFKKKNKERTLLLEMPNQEKLMTVYIKQQEKGCMAFVNGQCKKVETEEACGKLKITLYKAGLIGYDYTKLSK